MVRTDPCKAEAITSPTTHPEALNLVLDIVLQQIAKALPVRLGQGAKPLLEHVLVEDVGYAHAVPGRLGAVGWPDALPGRADVGRTQLDLLQTIDELVQVEDDVCAVADE